MNLPREQARPGQFVKHPFAEEVLPLGHQRLGFASGNRLLIWPPRTCRRLPSLATVGSDK